MARKKLNPLLTYSSNFELDGRFAPRDWKYELVVDYLKASPSYKLMSKILKKGYDPKEFTNDGQLVAQVVNDFGPIYRMQENEWWEKYGMNLYGVQRPELKVKDHGVLTEERKSIAVKFEHSESVVIEVPPTIGKTKALAQINQILISHNLSESNAAKLKPKYQFTNSKLSRRTLQLGLDALRQYQKNIKLWEIGNNLRLIPAQVFDPTTTDASNHSYNKLVLGIAASRLIKKAALIAENAARGNFPSDKPLKEAMLNKFTRPSGRPKKLR
jgi:hypothetical protein